MTDPAQPPRRPGPPAGVSSDRDVPDWEALARIVADEPAADDAARVQEAAARAWLAAHPAEAARLAALGQALPSARAAAAPAVDPPAVDVEAALSRVRHAAGLDRVASPTAPPAAPSTADAPRAPRLAVVRGSERRTAPRWRVAAGLAASAVIATGIGSARHLGRASGGRDGSESVAAANAVSQHHATRVGERQTLRLVDGSQVVLGPSSTLDVPAGFGGSARRVRLTGEAYFRAAHDARRPFEVAAGDAIVRDIGTAFVVRASERAGVHSGAAASGAAAVDVAVTDGAVQLRAAGAGAAPDSAAGGVLLRAGDRGRVLAAAGVAPAVSVVARGTDVGADTAWTAGRLVFRDAPLTEVAGALRRWYGVQLRFADPGLASRHLTATFAGESTDVVLRVVGLATGARLERRGDTVVVRGAAPSP